MRYSRFWTILLILLLPVLLVAFKNRMYQVVLMIMVIELLSIFFIASEKLRMTIWSLSIFQFCYILLLYGYRIIESLPISIPLTVVFGECLQLIPIIGIIYIQKMFKQDIRLGFSWLQIGSKKFYFFLGIGGLLMIALFSFSPAFISFKHFWLVISYCILHAILFEILWRGLLLTLFVQLINRFWAIILLSIAFAIYCYSFGYPSNMVYSLGIISIVLSYLKIKTNSLIPSILLHFVVILLFYLSGSLFIPL